MFSLKSLLLLVIIGSSNAFSVSSIRPPMTMGAAIPQDLETTSTTLFSKTRLQYRSQDDDYLYVDNSVATTATTAAFVPSSSSAFLPRAGLESADRKRAEQVMNIEMMGGRIAMVAAIVMFTNEVVFGTSLPQQIQSLFQ